MKEPRCGGCEGLGAHGRLCRTRPGWYFRRLAAVAGDLADDIGSNDCESANMAYAIAGRMNRRADEAAVATAGLDSVEQLIEDAKNAPECFKCREPITEFEDVRIVIIRVDGEPRNVWVHAEHAKPTS